MMATGKGRRGLVGEMGCSSERAGREARNRGGCG